MAHERETHDCHQKSTLFPIKYLNYLHLLELLFVIIIIIFIHKLQVYVIFEKIIILKIVKNNLLKLSIFNTIIII